jgi:hypothetical protein
VISTLCLWRPARLCRRSSVRPAATLRRDVPHARHGGEEAGASVLGQRYRQEGAQHLISRPAIVLYVRYPTSSDTGKQPACRRAAQKTQTYRSLRFPAVAALVPSAGTITLEIELRSDASAVSIPASGACPRCAARVPRIERATQGYRGGLREARDSRAPNFDIAEVVQNRHGSGLTQLGSVTQQRRRMHSIGGGSPHFGT